MAQEQLHTTGNTTFPAGNLALQVKPRPELELQQQLLTPLHPGPPTALSSPAREGTASEAEKPQEAKSLLAIKQGEGHLSWLLTLNMQK